MFLNYVLDLRTTTVVVVVVVVVVDKLPDEGTLVPRHVGVGP
jgi:hypothetical protein